MGELLEMGMHGLGGVKVVDACGHCHAAITDRPMWQEPVCPECAHPMCGPCAEEHECDPYEEKIKRGVRWVTVARKLGLDPHGFFNWSGPPPPPPLRYKGRGRPRVGGIAKKGTGRR